MTEAASNEIGVGSADTNGLRATRAIVDLDAIAANLEAVRRHLGPATAIMAVVKADGYGHGAVWTAHSALRAGAALLGVATVSEGQELRAAGIRAPVVLLGSIDPDEVADACRLGLEFTVTDVHLLEAIQQVAGDSRQHPVRVHVKIDTGLHRYGAPVDAALALVARIEADSRLELAGVCTHFASADEADDQFTATQLDRFAMACTTLGKAGISIPERHAANSAGILASHGAYFEIARLGIALYGVPPSDEIQLLPGMRPVMRIESRVARLIEIAAGEGVGYNRTYIAAAPVRAALVPIGYADGYRRAYSNCSWVGLHGRRAEVLGRVSMDQLVVGIPEGVAAAVGDTVHVMSDDPSTAAPTVADLARLAGTNTYEVLVGIRRRVPRVYLQLGRIVGTSRQGRTSQHIFN